MSMVDDAERIAREKCRACGKNYDDLTSEAKERLLNEAVAQLASEKSVNNG